MLAEEVQNKWKPGLEHADLDPIRDSHRRAVTAQILENTENALRESTQTFGGQNLLAEATPVNATGGSIDTFDPVLISLVRRSMPNLVAYDICGVQPMTGPTGLIFAMRARYANQTHTEAFYNESNTGFSANPEGNTTVNLPGYRHVGTVPGTANNAESNTYNYVRGVNTSYAEGWGNSSVAIPEMAFSIEKVTVTARSRALKAEYSLELAQDLKAIHGLDAETELANILSAEILSEINREVVRTINVTAERGASEGTTTAGIFDLDTDSNGRWSVEKFKGLLFQLDREANVIAKETRRGKGNFILCSSDVASALSASGALDYTLALSNGLQVDDTGNTFAGILNGRIRVYIDPYAVSDFVTVGYKGTNPYDAGIFYCPYVPLTMVRAVGEDDFQPKIGFKTRYGMVTNPFVGATPANGLATARTNQYYRIFRVDNILVS